MMFQVASLAAFIRILPFDLDDIVTVPIKAPTLIHPLTRLSGKVLQKFVLIFSPKQTQPFDCHATCRRAPWKVLIFSGLFLFKVTFDIHLKMEGFGSWLMTELLFGDQKILTFFD